MKIIKFYMCDLKKNYINRFYFAVSVEFFFKETVSDLTSYDTEKDCTQQQFFFAKHKFFSICIPTFININMPQLCYIYMLYRNQFNQLCYWEENEKITC